MKSVFDDSIRMRSGGINGGRDENYKDYDCIIWESCWLVETMIRGVTMEDNIMYHALCP